MQDESVRAKVSQRLMEMLVAESAATGQDSVLPWQVNAHINSYRASDSWLVEDGIDSGAINRLFDRFLLAHLKGRKTIAPELEPAVDKFEAHPTFESLVDFVIALYALPQLAT